jgi:hypothetical protein
MKKCTKLSQNLEGRRKPRLGWEGKIKMDWKKMGRMMWTGCLWLRKHFSAGFL